MKDLIKNIGCTIIENQAALIAGTFTLCGVYAGYLLGASRNKIEKWPEVKVISSAEKGKHHFYGKMDSVSHQLIPSTNKKLRCLRGLSGWRCKYSQHQIKKGNIETFYYEIEQNNSGGLFSFSYKYFFNGYRYRDYWIGQWVDVSLHKTEPSFQMNLYGPYYSRKKYYFELLKLRMNQLTRHSRFAR